MIVSKTMMLLSTCFLSFSWLCWYGNWCGVLYGDSVGGLTEVSLLYHYLSHLSTLLKCSLEILSIGCIFVTFFQWLQSPFHANDWSPQHMAPDWVLLCDFDPSGSSGSFHSTLFLLDWCFRYHMEGTLFTMVFLHSLGPCSTESFRSDQVATPKEFPSF